MSFRVNNVSTELRFFTDNILEILHQVHIAGGHVEGGHEFALQQNRYRVTVRDPFGYCWLLMSRGLYGIVQEENEEENWVESKHFVNSADN